MLTGDARSYSSTPEMQLCHLPRISARRSDGSELLQHCMRMLLIQACVQQLIDVQLSRHAFRIAASLVNASRLSQMPVQTIA